ncbi:MAG: hypothetical protein GY943_08575 [Chloroflexi bacterium]|nr:hypothetical protein [Chloroflexota bacterium]
MSERNKRQNWTHVAILIFIILMLGTAFSACRQPEEGASLPTAVSTVSLLTIAPPTETFLPPTLDLTATERANQTTPVPTNTRVVNTPTPVNAVINITTPNSESTLVMGSTIEIFGLVQKEENQIVWVSLVSANGRLLVEQQATINEIGWDTIMSIPRFVSGAATLQAAIRDADGTLQNVYQQPMTIVPDIETADRYILMTRPELDETAVSGFSIFFDGEIKFPTNNTLSISIWTEDCQTKVANQNFVLGSSNQAFSWQGFVVIPTNVDGPACAVASFGEPGAENWREAQVPISILPIDDREAKGIRISNPAPGSEVIAGSDLFINGTALNVSAAEMLVTILLENGRIVNQTIVTTDYWGYFETSVLLPIDIEGPAQIIAEAGEGDEFADGINNIIIVPPPTPTPVP